MKSKATFDEILHEVSAGHLITATLSSPTAGRDPLLKKVVVRPVSVKSRMMYQVSEHSQNKVTHRNVELEACPQLIEEFLKDVFKQGVVCTPEADYHLLVNKKKQMTILTKAPSRLLECVPHNRKKQYILEEGQPVPFLVDLGVMNPEGKVVAKKYDKFRQINRFIEMVRDIIAYLPKGRRIEIIDFGCGKAYLTFALYHYLRHIEHCDVNIVGLDLKEDVIEHCQSIADRLGFSHLRFAVGNINDHIPSKKIDMVISLHACDTATDAALEKAIKWGADVILCVPCCQHELFGQVKQESLSTLLRFGVLKERFAALATDAARAEILTILGYDVQILEFIDLEHTPKNLLIRAVKGSSTSKQDSAKARYTLFKQALEIEPNLERRFQDSFIDH